MPNPTPAAPTPVNSTALILCLVGLILAIFLNTKKKWNLGITAMLVALLIGVGYMGMNTNTIFASWPTTTVISVVLAVAYFGMLTDTGMMEIIGKRMIKMLGGNLKLLPLIAVPAISLVAFLSASNIPFIFGPLLVPMAAAGGMDLMIVVALLAYGGAIGGNNPWTNLTAQMASGFLQQGGYDVVGGGIARWIDGSLINILAIVLMYIVFKGYKTKKVEIKSEDIPKMNDKQKKALVLLIGTFVLLIVPTILQKVFPTVPFFKTLFGFFSNYMVFTIGIILCYILKIGTFDQSLRKVPWGIVWMIVGIMMLLTVANAAGFSTFMSGLISDKVPRFLLPAAFMLAACAMSYFASAFAVFPVLWAIAMPVAAATGISGVTLLSCIMAGAAGSGSASPLSPMGAVVLSIMPAEEQPKLGPKMILWSLLICLFWTVLAAIGIPGLGSAIMGV